MKSLQESRVKDFITEVEEELIKLGCTEDQASSVFDNNSLISSLTGMWTNRVKPSVAAKSILDEIKSVNESRAKKLANKFKRINESVKIDVSDSQTMDEITKNFLKASGERYPEVASKLIVKGDDKELYTTIKGVDRTYATLDLDTGLITFLGN